MQNENGYTLVELLVTLSIAMLLLGVISYNYGTFNDNIALSGSGQEVAIAIREAQVYGVNVREVSVGGGQFNSAYGIYVNPSANSTNYIVFADTNKNKKYDNGEQIESFNLRNGVKFSALCNGVSCPLACATSLSITFLRPNPDADINFVDNNGSICSSSQSTGKFRLLSPKGKTLDISVESTGQILAQ